MVLVVLAIAWMLGILLADLWSFSSTLLAGVTCVGMIGAAVGWRTPRLRLVCLCVVCAALGGMRYEAAQPITTARSVWLLAGAGDVMIQGTVHADPKRTEEGQQVVLQTEAVRVAGQTSPAEGLVLVKLAPYPEYHYGQRLVVMGRVQSPPVAERPGAFDYRAYLARKRIFALMNEPLVHVLPGEVGNPVLRTLLRFRTHCQHILLRELPEPQASIAVGILLGLKASIPDQVAANFAATGTSHMLVVSGWHLSIVVVLFTNITRRLQWNQRRAFWILLVAIWCYALFVGATATVVRAAIMASLTLLAQTTERRTEPWTLLLVACFGLSLVNPQILWDIGFQLSVLATASLFAFAQPIEQWLLRCPPLRWNALSWVTSALTATLSAQILALPIILYHFGNLSLIAPLANVLLAPVLPFAMLLGGIALVGGLVWLELGQLIALGAWLPFLWLSSVPRLLADLPWAAVTLPAFPLWLLLSYYAVVGGWWLWQRWALANEPDAVGSHPLDPQQPTAHAATA